MRGHYGEAGWSAFTALPFLGTIGKYGRGSEAVLEHLTSILKPGGKLIGEAGSKDTIRVVPLSQREALTTELSKVGNVISKPTYDGTFREISGLGNIGFRESKEFGPTIDIDIEGLRDIRKIHFK